ncbi:sortase domain-containing protein [Amycolatopsis anabasis]|uniref:sortase domain-containing protein n=1 Tax=Amycolatopsis anabasis TaxID=1840409 RepID=UPI00131D2818|nr:sortase [Amycolatopsis anabasis]
MTQQFDRRGDLGRLGAATAAVVVALAGALVGVALLKSPSVTASATANLPVPQPLATKAGITGSPGAGGVLAASTPESLEIPSIGVNARPLVELGRTPTGAMEVPGDARAAGWFTTNPTPGEPGAAVISGHVRYGHARAVFYRLRELRPGDPITVRRQDGTALVFTVYRTETHPSPNLPADVLAPNATTTPELRLTTSSSLFGGTADEADALVVSARLTPAD